MPDDNLKTVDVFASFLSKLLDRFSDIYLGGATEETLDLRVRFLCALLGIWIFITIVLIQRFSYLEFWNLLKNIIDLPREFGPDSSNSLVIISVVTSITMWMMAGASILALAWLIARSLTIGGPLRFFLTGFLLSSFLNVIISLA